ncbi:Lrp/AsnC family transcriptional regulator [Solitalea koreensis]|uniref:Lrp/AsnC family transcriptional regulator, leucine-responsive regulatory protein n=1 Tax=Solitalea koreensis TaxID=543615 RepID=A0A521EEA8_9SPHI|nr:Lrp/AsnC family transcriptional regulator [Solitalea koreensis]SMO81520.1 Lrp/AsnC family transcriptional regulator, leucine-responsive regulatory protein [Solitalea koreensis]
MNAHHLDRIDLHIIKLLQSDGRITNLQLSNEIGLSPAPTLERVRKLENQGYIKSYHAVVDEEALGFNVKCFIQITINLNVPDARNKFIQKINAIEEVVECHHVTGSSDFVVKLIAKDMKGYERIILEKLSKIEEIGHQSSMMILSSNVKPALPIVIEK